MTWFESLTSIPETNEEQISRQLKVDGEWLISHANGQRWRAGRLETPTLAELRNRTNELENVPHGHLVVDEVVADAESLLKDSDNAGALFQVASQFNLLEMAGPDVTPEEGVGIYEYDHTQGPACAVAAGAGTIYRNYFVPVGNQIGQTADCQIDCLADIGQALGNDQDRLWEMCNGYVLADESGLVEISERLGNSTAAERNRLRGCLRIGLQWDTQVTLPGCEHLVSQAYCSALPVAYNHQPVSLWEPFARLILEAAYEATMCAGVINFHKTGNKIVYLTLIGGGVFGNKTSWITDSLERALRIHRHAGLDVRIVSYGRSNPAVQDLIDRLAYMA